MRYWTDEKPRLRHYGMRIHGSTNTSNVEGDPVVDVRTVTMAASSYPHKTASWSATWSTTDTRCSVARVLTGGLAGGGEAVITPSIAIQSSISFSCVWAYYGVVGSIEGGSGQWVKSSGSIEIPIFIAIGGCRRS